MSTAENALELKVAFHETDAMGIVHHSNYLKYFEEARVFFLRRRGLNYRLWQENGRHLPLIESQCRYRRPARFEDDLIIEVKARIERLRLIFDYEIKNKQTKETLTTGSTLHVCVNDDMKIMELPDDLRGVICGS